MKLSQGSRLGRGDSAASGLPWAAQFCQGFGMNPSSLRKALFASEMVFSMFFLLLCFLAMHLPLRSVQCSMNHGKLEVLTSLPEITRCLQWCLPEGMVAGILGPILLAWGGFGGQCEWGEFQQPAVSLVFDSAGLCPFGSHCSAGRESHLPLCQ